MIIVGTEPVGKGEMGSGALKPNEARPNTRPITGFGRNIFITPEKACEKMEGPTVRMAFPADVYLTTQAREIIFYPVGHHEVPEELADHPYLRANEVIRLTAPAVRELPPILEGKEKKTAPMATK